MDSFTLEEASLILLSGLYSRLQSAEQEDVWIPFGEIPEITAPSLSVGYAVRVAEILEAQQFVEVGTSVEDVNLPTEIAITIEGIRHLESKEGEEKAVSAEPKDSESANREITVEVPAEAAAAWGGSWGRSWDRAPASDRVVPLNHNALEYVEAVKTLDDVIKEFREDHTFGNSRPQDKERVLRELEAGKDLMKEETARPRAIGELVLPALKWILDAFGKGIVFVAATEAYAAIKIWLVGLL